MEGEGWIMRRFKVKSGLPVIIYLLLVFGLCRAEAKDIMSTEDDKPEGTHSGKTVRVPQDKHSIQAAIDSADDDDIVFVSPGIYHEMITLKDKTITLASHFLETGDPRDISQTVLDGAIQQDKGSQKKADFVIKITGNTDPNLRIVGFTIQNGDDGITCSGKAQILHNRFTSNNDAIDYEGGGGVCQFNTFENNMDDAVDLDQATEVTITDNVIRSNRDDGIEIRFHKYSGPVLHIIIRNNVISGNGEDGIQIIDYPDRSDRVVRIQQNLIVANAMAAIGCMGDGNTKENYEGADIPERIYVINNTIVDNEYGVTGGDNLVALNNIFVNIRKSALKKVDGESVAAYNLFWGNGADVERSNVDEEHSFRKDPLLDENFRPMRGSPCIDAGTAQLKRKSETLLQLPRDAYSSLAPDLGAFEADSDSQSK
jgi:hypothetical protein